MNSNDSLTEKYLPHNLLAEKIILGNLLVSPDAIDFTIKSLNIEAFYFKVHQEIYKTIIRIHKNNKIPDIPTITTFLQDNNIFKEEIDGIPVLLDLLNQVPNLVNMDAYVSLVQDKYLRRVLIKLGYQIVNSSYITNISLENIINDLESEVFNLTKQKKNNRILSSAELLTNVFNDLKNKAKNQNFSGLNSGFYDLDSLTQGFQKSDLIIIAGRPSMGKTAFCLNVGINVLKETKLPIIFFSLEMSKEQLIYRLLAMETNINNMRLRSANIKQFEWAILHSVIKHFSQLPLFIDDTTNITIVEIKTKIKNILVEYKKIGLVIIDYLQLMENNSNSFKNSNRVQELSQITRFLKNLAREFNIPILVLSQLSRNVENRVSKRPILSDLRESGSIEQDADLVLMLYRDEYYNKETIEPNVTELIIVKHRNGPIGVSKLKFDAEYTRFKNI